MASSRVTRAPADVEASGSDVSKLRVIEPWFGLLVRLVLGGVALWAGIAKATDLPGSVRAVRAFELLPEALVPLAGHLLPFVEIAVGIFLIAGLLTRWVALINGVTMLAFVFGISWAWARGLNIDCGCFGGGGQLAEGESADYLTPLLRDIALVLGSAYLVWRPRTALSLGKALDLE